MARVRSLTERVPIRLGLHPTEVECHFAIVEAEGESYLQLSTFGSESREDLGTVSQTLQLDAATARRLAEIIKARL